MIIIVLDDDLITYFNDDSPGISISLGRMANSIMAEFDKLINTQKEFLPKRSKRPNYPAFIWIQAPLHNNFYNNSERVKFNRELINVARFHENTYVLPMKKIWDQADTSRI